MKSGPGIHAFKPLSDIRSRKILSRRSVRILLSRVSYDRAHTKRLNHTRDFHRKESDSVIETRTTSSPARGVTILSPPIKKKGKVYYYFIKIHSRRFSRPSAERERRSGAHGRKTIVRLRILLRFVKGTPRFPSFQFSRRRERVYRNSLKRIQMRPRLCIFMLPGRAATDVRNNYFIYCRAQRVLFVDVIAVRNFLTAKLLTHVHLRISSRSIRYSSG